MKKIRFVSKEDTKSVLYFKKNSNLHLKKTQIHFYFDEKLKSTSKKDVDLFYFDEKLRSTFRKDVDQFYLKKKKKSIQYMQISKTKKQIIVMIKESRTYFDNLN